MMAFTHDGTMQLGGQPPRLPKSKQPQRQRQAGGIPIVAAAPDSPIPYEPPVEETPPTPEPEEIQEQAVDQAEELFDEAEGSAGEYPFEPEPSEPAPLIVAPDGASIVTASETKRRREDRKRGRGKKKNPKSAKFIPEGTE